MNATNQKYCVDSHCLSQKKWRYIKLRNRKLRMRYSTFRRSIRNNIREVHFFVHRKGSNPLPSGLTSKILELLLGRSSKYRKNHLYLMVTITSYHIDMHSLWYNFSEQLIERYHTVNMVTFHTIHWKVRVEKESSIPEEAKRFRKSDLYLEREVRRDIVRQRHIQDSTHQLRSHMVDAIEAAQDIDTIYWTEKHQDHMTRQSKQK